MKKNPALPSTPVFLPREKTKSSHKYLLFLSICIACSLCLHHVSITQAVKFTVRDIQIDHCPIMIWQNIRELMRRRRQQKDDKRTLKAHNASNRTHSTSATLPFSSTLPSVVPHERPAQSQASIEVPVNYPGSNFARHNSKSAKHVHWHNGSGDHTVATELDARTNEATVSSSIQPSSLIAGVQLCPHDTLRFERARRLADFIGRGTRPRSHPALLSGRNGDHSAGLHRLCKPVPGSPNLIRGDIQFHSSSPEYFYLRGLFVASTWVINLLDLEEPEYNKKGFHDLLSQSKIELCPHQRLVDPGAFGEICKIAFPSKHRAQSSARCGGEERPRGSKLKCGQCATTIRIHDREFSIEIKVVRYLGKVKTEMDQLWWTQCRPTKGQRSPTI